MTVTRAVKPNALPPSLPLARAGHSIGGSGPALVAIYIATALMSELLTNNAAGAIMYPIAAIAGDQLGVTPRELSVAIMLGASAGFVNPFRCARVCLLACVCARVCVCGVVVEGGGGG
jgi:hypothetical protein